MEISNTKALHVVPAVCEDETVYENLPSWFNDGRLDKCAQDIVVDSDGTTRINKLGRFSVIGNLSVKDRMKFLRKVSENVGRFFEDRYPILSAMLPNNERVEAVHSLVSPDGPGFAMRIFGDVLTLDDMLELGSINIEQHSFLRAHSGRKNITVGGGVGSGKTTMLRAIAEEPVAKESRQVIIETDPEMQRPLNGLRLVAHKDVPFDTLLQSALRLIPEMIIVAEVRDGYHARALVHAAMTGHIGMSSVHAGTPLLAPKRIRELGKFVGGLPTEDVALACEVVVHVEKTGDGGRRVTEISTVGVRNEDFVCERVA